MDIQSKEYADWLEKVKSNFQHSQIKASVSVNVELLRFYWKLGNEIITYQQKQNWGSGFIKQLSNDLKKAFPKVKGFSERNLAYIRKWVNFYTENNFATSCGKIEEETLFHIPWGHNREIISKCKNVEEAQFYVQKTIQNNWSRNVLVHQIASQLYTRKGSLSTNFDRTLPSPNSDLASQIIKDPYTFDFLDLREEFTEKQLEESLIDNISNFLLELGTGFAYVGKQRRLKVGNRDFFIDLLFYHTQLHCYIVIELKTGEFEPEYAGKLNFYLKAVDEQLKTERDDPTIGILLCKSKDKVVAEYALSDIHKPMGIAAYQLTHKLPPQLEKSLPVADALEELVKGK
ncbi:PDDEXK nuclease domain-containing protein [Flammeovirga aprica]|uniref:DUF1016 domain-containing protein n=1 Tax=Flammeovirga aprica JL-4 TaxID=694437 RepID=A0A7X9RZ79_9BACT|nr:PDDEXK nuclease domain-containing protein [Flammeovirga aprica]NME71421.1 DUF1016 domain-containing protein [Flammeovirga aprica JL-4]